MPLGLSSIAELAIAEISFGSSPTPPSSVHRINGFWLGPKGTVGYYYSDTTEILPVVTPNTEFPT